MRALATVAAPEYVEPRTIALPSPALMFSLMTAKLALGSVPALKLYVGASLQTSKVVLGVVVPIPNDLVK